MLPLLRSTARRCPRTLLPSSCSSRIILFRPASTSAPNESGSRPSTAQASTGGGAQPAASSPPKDAPVMMPSGPRDAGDNAAAVIGLVWGVSFIIWTVLFWKLLFDVGYQLEELERLKPMQVTLHDMQQAQELGKGPTKGPDKLLEVKVIQLENTVKQLESELRQTLAEVGYIKAFLKDTSGFQPPESVKKEV
ncbi:hypothetical protein JCM1840_007676 [Sporobolomyces johnsonii]